MEVILLNKGLIKTVTLTKFFKKKACEEPKNVSGQKFLICAGLAVTLGLSLILFVTFIIAFLSPYGRVIVDVNAYNEALIELVALCVLMPVCLFSILRTIGRVLEDELEVGGHG